MRRLTYQFGWQLARFANWADLVVLVAIGVVIAIGAQVARYAPVIVDGPEISLNPAHLPYYAGLSVARMFAAYLLSLAFTLVYGYVAARNRRAEAVLIPLLDILQSVPILSFLPVVLLGLAAVLSPDTAAELASIVLIFTSQVWNMTFGWYQSLTTIPAELREAASMFRLNGWLRFRMLELPFAAIGLIWNSMMSWAGGWFFLMAAEMFTVGDKDFRLLGLGSYLQSAAHAGDLTAILWGVGALILVIGMLDQLVWRPLLVWAERFKLETVSGEAGSRSWFYDVLHNSRLAALFSRVVFRPVTETFDAVSLRRSSADRALARPSPVTRLVAVSAWVFRLAVIAALAYGVVLAAALLTRVTGTEWRDVTVGLMATLLRVTAAMVIALAWTIPAGVAIGTNRKLAGWLQPLVQITASIPATALFPVLLLMMLTLPGGLNVAAVALMLMGTQWYLLFNVIAGVSAIPQDLLHTSHLLRLSRWDRWRTLILPALFPYIITGAITASGGAWNASIVAEYTQFGGKTIYTTGLGAQISLATEYGNYPLLLAATLVMVVAVVVINRLFWRRLYRLAETRYRME